MRRDVLRGKAWTAAPTRVIHDRPDERCAGGRSPLAAGRWELGRWTWRDTLLLTWLDVDEDFGVCRFLRTESGRENWYINVQRPYRRTRIGVDTFDLLLDLVGAPDGSRWTGRTRVNTPRPDGSD